MGYLIAFVALALLLYGMILWHIPKTFLALVAVVGLGAIVVFAHYCGAKAMNDAYAAAARQGISITIEEWQRIPMSTTPCEVELKLEGRGESAKLTLPTSGKVATPDTLKAACSSG